MQTEQALLFVILNRCKREREREREREPLMGYFPVGSKHGLSCFPC